MTRYLDPQVWLAVPFHFWSVVFFIFGSMVGSFLNVCIYRVPRGLSVASPPSHCPHCNYSIPWYLNVPLVTWLYLRGQCANCKASISPRYFVVELLTGLMFLAAWLAKGAKGTVGFHSPWVALAICLLLAGLIAATFIDFEHFIIPDEITIGGMVAGFVISFLIPGLHQAANAAEALKRSGLGIVIGAGVVYAILRLGKLLFGKQKVNLPENSTVLFTETALVLPDQQILYEDLFYRKSDSINVEAKQVELIDRCYREVLVRLSPAKLTIGEETFRP